MTKKDKWEIERDEQDALKTKAMKSLTVEKLHAIKETHKTIPNCLMMIRDCNDLYMSDIGKLENSFWKLKHQFLLENDE